MENYDTRLMVILAGYNKKNKFFENLATKINYNEDLISSKDKANFLLGNKTVIEYPLGEIEKINSIKTIIVGNSEKLQENLSGKYNSIDKIVEQGNSFYENAKIGENLWEELFEKYSSEQKKVSPHIFYLFADTFYAKKDSIIDVISKIEKRDADISFSYIKDSQENQEIRDLFNYRPWGKLSDIKFRNANIGAIRKTTFQDKFTRGIPENKEFLIQMTYNSRKLCNPYNIYKVGQAIGKEGFNAIKDYFKGDLKLKTIESIFSNTLKCDFSFIEVNGDLELDIDSKKDYFRAQKMLIPNNFLNSDLLELNL